MQRRHPASDRAVLGWRIGLALLGTTAVAWASLAAAFGPLAGPLPLLWLLITAAAQTTWLIVRHNR